MVTFLSPKVPCGLNSELLLKPIAELIEWKLTSCDSNNRSVKVDGAKSPSEKISLLNGNMPMLENPVIMFLDVIAVI